MKKILLLTGAILLLFTGNIFAQPGTQKNGWPSVERYNFISECIKAAKAGMSEDSARFYCYCMQFKVEAKYPTIEEAGKITENDMQSPEWQKDIKTCLTGGSWSAKERSAFLSNCISSAKTGMGEEKAKNYCECMVYKVESRYPNAADAGELTTEKLNSPEWKKILQGCLDF